MVQAQLLARLKELEAAVTYRQPPPAGRAAFHYISGDVPVLISAPHGAAHRRDGRIKYEDEFTAALACWLGEYTGAHVLCLRHQMLGDPNWDRESPYKQRLRQIAAAHNIRFVLDIHGMSNRYKFGLALGTMNGQSCPQHEPHIVRTLTEHGFLQAQEAETSGFEKLEWRHFVVNFSKFTGGITSHTVTRFASQQMGIPALQVEICSSLRIVERSPHGVWPHHFVGDGAGILQVCQALAAVVKTVQ